MAVGLIARASFAAATAWIVVEHPGCVVSTRGGWLTTGPAARLGPPHNAGAPPIPARLSAGQFRVGVSMVVTLSSLTKGRPMADVDPTDHARTTIPRAGEAMKDTRGLPGYFLMGAAIVAWWRAWPRPG